ncbi:dienelactone hydrolase family protein [Bacillus sp. RO3]|nr:dienelactone hydrolase family protein [Bacillus sp. RO3]
MPDSRNRENLVIIIHEIHGVNRHMEYMSTLIGDLGMDVICPNLYPPEASLGESEEDAYKSFFQHVGFQKAAATIKELMEKNRSQYKNIYLVGFSVGATVAWLCSDHSSVKGIFCFYGSRIRDYVHMNPTCPTQLFFSRIEKSFDVNPLLKELEKKENASISFHLFDAPHGFANPYSNTFSQDAFDKSFALLKGALTHATEVVER